MQTDVAVRWRLALKFFCAMACLSALAAASSDVKVIANFSVKSDTISPGELRRIFLLEVTSLDDGTHVQPVLRRNGWLHEIFLHEFLNTDSQSLSDYYGTVVFTGKATMPREFGSDDEVTSYVARTKGAIGYVSITANTAGTKVLEVRSSGDAGIRTLIRQVDPQYPDTLKRLGIGGTVRLRITISPEGAVENVVLLGGNPALAEAAIAAVRKWVYSGSHARTTMEVSVPFVPGS
jgi:TonB family protein